MSTSEESRYRSKDSETLGAPNRKDIVARITHRACDDWWLIMESGARLIEVRLDRPTTLIGRHPKCDLRVLDPKVSRLHCALRVEGGRMLVCDLDSANGTYVNNRRVVEHVVTNCDCLMVGGVALRLFSLHRAARRAPGDQLTGTSVSDLRFDHPRRGAQRLIA